MDLKTEIQAKKASDRIKTVTEQVKRLTHFEKPTTASFVSYDAGMRRCVYCNGIHFSASCENVTDTGQRREILRRSNRCYICLSLGHRSFECNNITRVCRKCNKAARHHQSLCNFKTQSRDDKRENASQQGQHMLTRYEGSSDETVKTTTTSKKGSTVLL